MTLLMTNFLFALNATVPVFLVILLGYFLQRVHFLNDAFNKTANEYVFRCALPISLFRSIAGMDFYSEFDPIFCLFCFTATPIALLVVGASFSGSEAMKRWKGAFVRAI